jgi:Ca2+-binding EF-hand superfamily protein
MSKAEFKALIISLLGKVADFEINSIFKQLDTRNSGSIPKERFLDWFGRDEQEKLFQVGIEDIIKPLVTYMRRKNLNVVDIYNKYDTNKNQLLSANELQTALKDMLKFEMTTEEVKTMHEFFRAKFRRSEIKRAEFAQLV